MLQSNFEAEVIAALEGMPRRFQELFLAVLHLGPGVFHAWGVRVERGEDPFAAFEAVQDDQGRGLLADALGADWQFETGREGR